MGLTASEAAFGDELVRAARPGIEIPKPASSCSTEASSD